MADGETMTWGTDQAAAGLSLLLHPNLHRRHLPETCTRTRKPNSAVTPEKRTSDRAAHRLKRGELFQGVR